MESSGLIRLAGEERQFGRYRLLYRIARGGMAAVYLARLAGPGGFEKLVAIKRIHQHLSVQEDFLRMFQDEACLAARIAHPNVAQVIEFGQHGDSTFMAMEYVEGESLMRLLTRTRIPITVAARIIADALAGLQVAHELQGPGGEPIELVHRDLSPSNILISYDGAVKVVDFGVARARGRLHATEARTLKGKFAYMAPEQARIEPVDRRADIFAAGILLYEATTYTRLFRTDPPEAALAMILACDKIKRPSQVVAGYPPQLEAVVMRALRHNREERFVTAREMQLALEDYIYASGAPLPATIVGDLMRATFPDRIELKKQRLRDADRSSAVLALDSELSDSGSFEPELVARGAAGTDDLDRTDLDAPRLDPPDADVEHSASDADAEQSASDADAEQSAPATSQRYTEVYRGTDPIEAQIVVDLLRGNEHEIPARHVGTTSAALLGAGPHIFEQRIEVPGSRADEARELIEAFFHSRASGTSSEAALGDDELRPPRRSRVVAGGIAFVLPGAGHFYARRPYLGGLLLCSFVIGLLLVLGVIGHGWEMVGLTMMLGEIPLDVVGGQVAVTAFNRGRKMPVGRQLWLGLLLGGYLFGLGYLVNSPLSSLWRR